MAISKEQIFQVADELDSSGQNPTLVAVRKALDGGSYTTISEAMKEWRAAKAADVTSIQEPPPPSVMDKLSEIGTEIWVVALELANGRLASEREGLELTRQEMEASRLEAVELADQLTVELDDSRNQVASLKEVTLQLQVELDGLKAKLATATERATTAEARSSEMELRAGDLRSELDRAHHEADRSRVAAERSVSECKAELTQVLTDAKRTAKEYQDKIETLRAQQSQAQESAQALTTTISSLESQQAQAEIKLASLNAEVERVAAERDSAIKDATVAKEAAAVLRGRVEGLEAALSRVEK